MVDRIYEKGILKDYLKHDPSGIILVTGPVSCGKSTLVVNVLKGRKNVAHFDVRDIQFKTVHDLASKLQHLFGIQKISDLYNKWVAPDGKADWMNNVIRFIWGVRMPFLLSSILTSQPDLESVLRDIESILRAAEGVEEVKPVLFIDEFQAFRELLKTREGQEALKKLLLWFVKVSKDLKLCHIVLSSSDCSSEELFTKCLIDPAYITGIIVDDVCDPIELQDLLKELEALHGQTITEEMIGQAIEQIGGRIPDLREYLIKKEQGINDMRDREGAVILRAMHPSLNGWFIKAWDEKHFAKVMKALYEAEHHIVSKDELLAKTGVPTGSIEQFVKENFIVVLPGLSRCYHKLEWKGPKPIGPVIKARSPLFLQCWQETQGKK